MSSPVELYFIPKEKELKMEISSNLCSNALRKTALLITKASELGMDISGYGYADENPNSGAVYLWLEDYPFTLFIDLSGDDEVKAQWVDPSSNDEEIISAEGESLYALTEWADDLFTKAEQRDCA